MNITLEQTEEYVNGAVINRYGDTFVRGNNGAFISTLSIFILLAVIADFFLVLYISAAETIYIPVYLVLLSERSLLTEALGRKGGW